MAKGKAKRGGGAVRSADFSVDPLLVGADREFAGRFPPGLLAQCGVVPLRLFRDVALVTAPTRAGQKGIERLRKATPLRLVTVPAIHDYGVELFLRYMDSGDASAPPLWLPESRRAYLARLGDFRAPQSAMLIASLLLTSPLAPTSPVLVCKVGGEGHALYLHGMSGLKTGIRFPATRFDAVVARLRIEFGMDGKRGRSEPWSEGRGLEERGLGEFGALDLPVEGSAFVIEPRGGRR